MSIVSLVKVTFYGHTDDRQRVLSDLQGLGCLHLIPLAPVKETLTTGGPSSRSREALRFLRSCPNQRRQVRHPQKFDVHAIEAQTLALLDRSQDLEAERDFLVGRIANLKPWGEFSFPAREALNNLRLWFYIVPHKDMQQVEAMDLIWKVVFRDNRFCYVVVISENQPTGMPVERVRTGSKSLSQLENRLEDVEIELEDLQAERASLTRWCRLFAGSIDRLEDQAAVKDAIEQTYTEDPIFALQAWTPKNTVDRLQRYANDQNLVLEAAAPQPEETPPTLMQNPRALAGGQDLVSFYTTPRYWLWDPSIIVFFSFAVFFAMIFADAGYSAILGLMVAGFWKKMGRSDAGRRFRILLLTLVVVGLVYGVIVGSYFGISPAENSLPGRLQIIDMMNFNLMMQLSILLGGFHLVIANAVTAWHFRRSIRAAIPLAWVFIFLGAMAFWQAIAQGEALGVLKPYGLAAMGLGLAGVLLFSSAEGPLWKRLLKGLGGLTGLSNAFGDALSYLRLFALGLASESLASTFNGMAGQVKGSLPGVGILFAFLIILLGHTLNFVLSLSSGFIHGLRLNFIEFFRWSIPGEGRPFNAFARKEKE
ncbi:MAG: V-type ATPase 116kDa subunit family protein [Desulfobacterales bacterium]|jgi:V/A-type H+-transporting ATPase subunit I